MHGAACAASGNDYQKERQFKKINSQKDSIEVAMVRGGKQTVVKNIDVVVGDVLLLDTGDKVGSRRLMLLAYQAPAGMCILAGLGCRPPSLAVSSMNLSTQAS